MRGDRIIVEPHHRLAAAGIVDHLRPRLIAGDGRCTLSIAGESGSGKSETATAVAEALEAEGITSLILQQDDYYVHPPRTNDQTRRADIDWVGPGEVRLDLLDSHLQAFLEGATEIEKPLVIYEDDRIDTETLTIGPARLAIAEGTYTTLLDNARTHVFIDRNYRDTRGHREKRNRAASELDAFTERVLAIEHDLISAHKARAELIVAKDYTVRAAA